jgi:hypothetical protein
MRPRYSAVLPEHWLQQRQLLQRWNVHLLPWRGQPTKWLPVLDQQQLC